MIHSLFQLGFSLIGALLPLGATVFLGWVAWIFWRHYVQQHYLSGMIYVLLEIKPPREVLRSPKAMELFFTNALYHLSVKGLLEKYWLGAVWYWFSLEIASIDGQVHFYIRAPSRLKGLIETQMYAQYPQAEITEVDDYTLAVDKISPTSDWNLWGCEFKFARSDVFPIKTYIDFGLDKDPKEEYKVDSLSPVIELFGSIEKGEQMWVQLVVRANQKKYHTKGTWFKKHDLVTEAEHVISHFSKEFTNVRENKTKEIRPAPWHTPVIDAINKKVAKLTFECGIRACYVAKKEAFQNNSRRNLRLIFRQYSSPQLNSFDRFNSTQFDYPWQYTEKSLLQLKDRMLEEYRERAFYHLPLRHGIPIPWPLSIFLPKYFHHHPVVLNTEELATIFHFPGQILKVPGLERVESKEASPPTNLPT
ncbi:MAG: hypothetical protein NTZ44_04185 [Candidatus Nomurabacteria bacterium]|nr:hypothetical protein [Candidatus Nomurabacteria bacterium]